MNDYKFDLGFVCGRFNHLQNGHISLIDTATMLCKRTFVGVGSAQEYGTLRNPFRVETRIRVIKEVYPNRSEEVFMVGGINDLTNEYDITSDWGKYLKAEVISRKHKFANLMVYGNDEFRSNWFAPEDLVETAEFIVPRSRIPISGTMVRGMLLIDDEENWQKATHPFTHSMYGELRAELMGIPIYKEIYDHVRKMDLSLQDFMKVYKEFEEIDKSEKLASLEKLKLATK